MDEAGLELDDPSDFPPAFPHLRDLDSHVRCVICGEIYKGCVITPCLHLFCSLCIRQSLMHGQKEWYARAPSAARRLT
jgi:E3 ubiquitin-protein ligase RAD18